MAQPIANLFWRRIARSAILSATPEDVLADISTAMAAAGWTVEEDDLSGTLEAIALTSPGSETGLRIVIAMAAAGSPTMISPANFVADTMLVGIAKDVTTGTIETNGWEAANPFGSGTFSGYYRSGPAITTASHLTIFESDDGVAIIPDNDSNKVWPIIAGAIIDPLSDDPADSEANGAVFGMAASGSVAPATSWGSNSSGANNAFLNAGAFADSAYVGGFRPGTTTFDRWNRANIPTSTAYTSTYPKKRSGRASLTQIKLREQASDYEIGMLRGIFRQIDRVHDSVITVAGPFDAGYTWAPDTSTAADALFFQARDNRDGAS